MLPAYKKYKISLKEIDNSYTNQKQILSLPIYPEMENSKINFICNQIKKFFS